MLLCALGAPQQKAATRVQISTLLYSQMTENKKNILFSGLIFINLHIIRNDINFADRFDDLNYK